MIDFTDPAQVTNQGKPIPINTEEKYIGVMEMIEGQCHARSLEVDDDLNQQTEQRVRNGMTITEIHTATEQDLDERYPDTKY